MAFPFSKVFQAKSVKEQSNESLLLDYFKMRGDLPFASYDIQSNAVAFFKNVYNKTVQPDTLNRLWRAMRNEYTTDIKNSKLYKHGLRFKTVLLPNGRKGWIVTDE